ncbi:ester cyclase [Ralstonia insidiosa]|jgi:predicted ester cyclase|uniref:ester cyclase n=1 Tax=Ralstonia TaxID=48736 RepID=UPI0006648538|nr:ester cyclase [Ralstonia insidiosa]KMW45394.1 ester cyclase [Ralstonia sp. MD27]MBX3774609.1 ester cyclase [Ralstonia pickettii]NOZ17220.1 ester cyclase [Betaproteobacteria bacterium]MBA9860072.1 ester cyclase [Ralstonia insidiosa]MBA9873675.1 ester cyclase [Ralstonia insidiosa]
MPAHPVLRPVLLATTALALLAALPTFAADDELVRPQHLAAPDTPQAAATVLAARRYATFWHTGDARYATQALSSDFADRTLPAGRVQGQQGPLDASRAFRAAVPDMRVEIEDMVVAGDRVAVHLRFRGHFTGEFGHTHGQSQPIDFQAFDLYRVADGKIAENWHLEDNQTLLGQMGLQP